LGREYSARRGSRGGALIIRCPLNLSITAPSGAAAIRGKSNSPQRKSAAAFTREKWRHQSCQGCQWCGTVSPRTGRGVIESIERHLADTTVQAVLCCCSKCSHLWLLGEGRAVSRRCPRCKARRWNVTEPEFHPPGDALREIPISRRNQSGTDHIGTKAKRTLPVSAAGDADGIT